MIHLSTFDQGGVSSGGDVIYYITLGHENENPMYLPPPQCDGYMSEHNISSSYGFSFRVFLLINSDRLS